MKLPSTTFIKLLAKNKTNTSGAGFTLVEILVGISIIIATSTIVVTILISSFRTSSKTTISDIVRQNGNNSIIQLSKIIQFADEFRGISKGGVNYIESCTTPSEQSIDYDYIKVLSGNREKIISCDDTNGVLIDGRSLFDQKRVSLVTGSCKFRCSQKGFVDTPVISINFSLKSGASGSTRSSLPEKNTVIDFKTSIKMRNQ